MIVRAAPPRVLPPIQPALSSFAPVPPGTLAYGLFNWGYLFPTGTLIRDVLESIAHHVLIAGPTGSGKTTLLYYLLSQLINWCNLWIFDLKDDFRRFAATHLRMLLFHDRFPFVPLKVPSYLSRHEHSMIFAHTLAESLYGAELFVQVCLQGLERAYIDHPVPSIEDLRHAVERLATPKDTWRRRDSIEGVVQRLRRIELRNEVMATAREGFGVEDLCERSFYLPVTYLTDVDEFTWTSLSTHLGIHRKAKNLRGGLRTALVMDEGAALWGEHAGKRHISGAPLLVGQLPTAREFGSAFIVTSTTVAADQMLIANCGTHIILPLATAEEARVAQRRYGFTDNQTRLLPRLPVGQFVLHLGRRCPTPIHAMLPDLHIEKTVPQSLWEYAVSRTDQRAPSAPPTRSLTAPSTTTPPNPQSPSPSEAQPTTSSKPPIPATLPITTTTPPAPPPKPTAIALNNNQERLNRSVVERIAPITWHFDRLDLHPDEGNAAAKQLVLLGLATREPIVVRSGKGGRAIALVPTPAGIERSGTKPPRGTRGGDSVQHQYLVEELARLLDGSKPEAIVGTKSVDILLTYNAGKHAALAIALNTIATPPVILTEGQVVAAEVEVSAPDRTISANAIKNNAAGIPLTVIAVMPKALPVAKRTIAKLDQRLRATLTLVDALRFLDHLRAGREA
jgi:DNA polymerase III delta prime subunit